MDCETNVHYWSILGDGHSNTCIQDVSQQHGIRRKQKSVFEHPKITRPRPIWINPERIRDDLGPPRNDEKFERSFSLIIINN